MIFMMPRYTTAVIIRTSFNTKNIIKMNKKLIFTLVSALVSTQAFAEVNLNLNPVVVTATRSAQNSFDLPVSIDAVDGETIRDNRLGANLSEIAPRVAGVVINNRFQAAQELAISTRGFGARSLFGVKGVRIYTDGIPLTTPDGQGQLGALNLDTVGQVEFLRGPFSALYGNSSGGVVQAITRDGAKTPTLTGGITFGSYNTMRESLTLEGQTGELNYILNTTQITSDGYRDHSKYRKDNFNGKVSYQANEDTKITFIANYLNQPYTQDPQGLSPAQFKQDPKQTLATSISRNTRVTREQTIGGVTIDHNLSDNQSIKLTSYYGERSNLQYLATNAVAGIDRNFGGVDLRWTMKDMYLSMPYSLTFGVNFDMMDDVRTRFSASNGIKGSMTRKEIQKANNFDQYAQLMIEPTDKWLLLAGVRHSKLTIDNKDRVLTDGINSSGEVDYSNTSPALGVTYKITPTLNIYANYGTGFESATFAEMTYSDLSGNGPNLALKPSKTKNYEAGIKAFVTDNTRVNLAVFKVDAKKEIVNVGNSGPINVYSSLAETERKGIELSVDSKLPNNFSFYGAYTLMDAEFKNSFCGKDCTAINTVSKGNKIPGTYTSTTYSELSWKLPAYGFSTAVEGIYFSSTNAYDSNWNANKAESYTLFNLRAGFVQNIGNWKLSEFARVDNISDKSYVSTIKVNSSESFEPGFGRNYMLGVSASYMFK